MKKILIITLLIVGCAPISTLYKNNFVIEKTTAFFILGMTKEEFNRKNPNITEIFHQTEQFTTYIDSEQKYRYIMGLEIPMRFEEYMFEFKNDTLIKVYRGRNSFEREIDYNKYPNSNPK